MTEDDKLYIDWMIGMVFKEKAYPAIVDFWMDAIQEYIRKVLNRGRQHPKSTQEQTQNNKVKL